MTVDEELNRLEDDIRRLKVEYEVYFNGGSPRPPHDTVTRVERLLKRYASDSSKLSFSQRFKFQSLQQKYAIHHDVWLRKLRDREEGRGRFSQKAGLAGKSADGEAPVRIVCRDPENEKDKVEALLDAMVEAKRRVGESVDKVDPAAFSKFVTEKTRQIKESMDCERVQFTVSVEDGKVKFKASKAE